MIDKIYQNMTCFRFKERFNGRLFHVLTLRIIFRLYIELLLHRIKNI
jgi:hypothetical protein